MPDEEQAWTPVSTNPPKPGQYEVRIKIGDLWHSSRRYWDGSQWRSRFGRFGTAFGSQDSPIEQYWRAPVSGQEGLVHGESVACSACAVPEEKTP